MAMVIEACGDYLLLPRPWLEQNSSRVRPSDEPSRNAGLYVRGDALIGGRTVRLPYWHKVAMNAKSKA